MRLALGANDLAGRAWFHAQATLEGFEVHQDGAGNQSIVWPSKNPAARTVIFGSHLDSVPNGGKYDGPLGVLAGLACLRAIRDAGITLKQHLELINFTDEEGTQAGLFGSRALAGIMTEASLNAVACGPAALDAALARTGLTRASVLTARRDPAGIAAYVELHIEQGTRLEDAGLQIAAVSAIVGIRSFWLNFGGQAAHAGAMPMAQRSDALEAAARFVVAAKSRVEADHFPGVMNCGQAQVHPGAFNIVPASVRLALEFRHGSARALDAMQSALLTLAQLAADQARCTLEIQAVNNTPPALFDVSVLAHIEASADRRGLSHTRLLSFAGHDAQSMASICPSAMIFVPSIRGISHHPAERTNDVDVVNGANVLLDTVIALGT